MTKTLKRLIAAAVVLVVLAAGVLLFVRHVRRNMLDGPGMVYEPPVEQTLSPALDRRYILTGAI